MGEKNSRLLETGNIEPPVSVPDTETPKWYQDVSLEDAEVYINANLKSAVRSVIAIGYYLKCVWNGELFREAGYENIWDYAKERFGFSKSTTSRYMKRNDRFSKDGNSPVLDERYSAFNKSQLQEMLGLDEEQLEQVTPDMAVQDIRAMRKPREIPCVEIPGQGNLEEYPGFLPEDMLGEEAEAAEAAELVGEESAEDVEELQEGAAEEPSEGLAEVPAVAISQQEPEATLPPRREEGPLPDESWNIKDLPQAKDKYIRSLAEAIVDKLGEALLVPGEVARLTDNTIFKKISEIDNNRAIPFGDGYSGLVSPELVEFWKGNGENAEDLGVCSFARLATQIRKAFEALMRPETDADVARKCLEEEETLLNKFLAIPDITEDEPEIQRQKVLVDALKAYIEILEPPREPLPLQPLLPEMKNNGEHKAWLATFHDWPVWFEVPEAAEVYYRYDLPDRSSLVICEYHYWAEWLGHYGDDPERTGTREYLLVPGYHYLEDCKTNRTAMIEKLKEVQKK